MTAAFATNLFNATYYLQNNEDVLSEIAQGHFTSALDHFTKFGRYENRSPNATWNATQYLIDNVDVANAVGSRSIQSAWDHFVTFGVTENRATGVFTGTFNATAYLAANADVQASVTAGSFTSAYDHFLLFGVAEGRAATNTDGTTISMQTGLVYTLTTGVDSGAAFTGTTGNDTFNADNTGTTPVSSTADSLNGGAGTDTLNVFSDGTAGSMPALTSVETVNVYDQDAALDVSASSWSSVTTLNLVRGDGAIVTVGANVATIGLENITVAATDTTTDDIVVNFGAARTSATLNFSAVNGTAGDLLEDIEVNGAAITTANVNVTGASSFDALNLDAATIINVNASAAFTVTSLETSATAAALTITGAGAVSLGELDTAINTVTSTATAALTAAIGAAVDTVVTLGSGNDVITASTADTIATTDALAVNAGDGTADILIILAAADVNSTADGGRYTNFETVRVDGSYDADNIAGITALQITGTTASQSYTDLTATQAANIQVRGDTTSATFALKVATGTADVLTLTMGTGLTTSAATDIVTGMTVTGFETLNIVEGGGATAAAGDARTAIVAAFTGATLNDINLSGRAVTLSNIATTVAVDINGSALTGNAHATATTAQGLSVAGSAVAGSVITGSAVRDTFTVGAEGSTYDAGAGNDIFTTTEAILLADGTTDGTFVGGIGTDKMVVSTTAATLVDTHFIKMSGFESLTTSTGATAITTGAAFNAAFTSGATVTTDTLTDGVTYDWASGLYSGNTTITIDGTALVANGAGEDVTVTTGSGDDTVTLTGTAWIGAAGDSGTITISTGIGADTISISHGTLLVTTTSQNAIITGGAGADLITKVGTNSTTVTALTQFVMAAGDSGTTAATMDQITGFDLGVTVGTIRADTLDFEGTAAVSAFSDHADFGVIKGHTLATAGIVTFDDIDTFATALVISSTNIADVVGYLNANLAVNGTVGFAYDSDNSGSADGTMVYHQGSSLTTVADDMVFLVGVTGGSLVVQGGTTGANSVVGIL